MNINLKFLFCGAAMCLIPQYVAGQCVETDCATLGYTDTSCPGDNGLKCPFG